MANTYSSLFYHVIFSTRNRTAFSRPEIEERVWAPWGKGARGSPVTAVPNAAFTRYFDMLTMDRLREVITEGRSIELLNDGIYTVLSKTSQHYQYDQKAAIYDFLVSSRLYNRISWGTSPDSYVAFAAQAVKSDQRGLLLDAGCGSLVFTARAHLESGRPVIACDQSLDMLHRARRRLMRLSGSNSEQIILLQADLSDPPFQAASFQTILCMNLLHHLADAAGLLQGLKATLVGGGQLYLTTLVKNNRFVGDRYLNLLHKQGWIVRPRNEVELKRLVEDALSINPGYKLEGNMAYVTAAVAQTRNGN